MNATLASPPIPHPHSTAMNHLIKTSTIRDTIAALEWAQQNLGRHTRPSPIDHALAHLKASIPNQPEAANTPQFQQEYACIPTGPDGKPIHTPLTKEQVINNIQLIHDLSLDPATNSRSIQELTSIILQRGIA